MNHILQNIASFKHLFKNERLIYYTIYISDTNIYIYAIALEKRLQNFLFSQFLIVIS